MASGCNSTYGREEKGMGNCIGLRPRLVEIFLAVKCMSSVLLGSTERPNLRNALAMARYLSSNLSTFVEREGEVTTRMKSSI